MRNQQQIIVNNKYRFTVPGTNQSITIPIEMKWDFLGRDDSIDVYQEEVIEIVTGIPEDFEVIRFAHDSYGQFQETKLNYEFHFYFYYFSIYNKIQPQVLISFQNLK